MLIEAHTLREMVDTFVLPSAFRYHGELANAAGQAKGAGIKEIPQIDAANRIGKMITELRTQRDKLNAVIEKAEGMHDAPEKQAAFLTADAADTMAAVRGCCDALEVSVSDECWTLPKYREMLFPV
jgi:glutamine synthetase